MTSVKVVLRGSVDGEPQYVTNSGEQRAVFHISVVTKTGTERVVSCTHERLRILVAPELVPVCRTLVKNGERLTVIGRLDDNGRKFRIHASAITREPLAPVA